MDMWNDHMLSVVLFLPGVSSLLIIFLPDRIWQRARLAALAVSLVDLALAFSLLAKFEPASGFQFLEKITWIERYNVSYFIGVDGLGLVMVLLTAFLTPLAIIAPFDGAARYRSVFYGSLLVLETGMHGVFMSLDLVLFYLFWEAMLIPVYFIIGVWGGERRILAAVKFMIYTIAGSLLLLLGILLLFNHHAASAGYGTFSFPALVKMSLPPGLQGWLLAMFFIAFAVKAPVFPFHTWLPDAYCESPTAGTVLMSAILAKMGVYGFLRFCLPLFPEASRAIAPWAAGLAIISIIYGAFLALAQDDLKRLVAYSSISHLGFITLGIFAFNFQGAAGALVQMVSHGLVTGGLFLILAMLAGRTGTRSMSRIDGLSRKAPLLAASLTFFGLASMGLPGLSSFIGEFLIITGAFRFRLAAGFLCAVGLVLGAIYILRMLGRVVFESVGENSGGGLKRMGPVEVLALVPLVAGIVLLGIFPGPLIQLVRLSLSAILGNPGGM